MNLNNTTAPWNYQTPNFSVTIETLPEDKLPQYVVRNKETGVIEFFHNVLYIVKQWTREMDELIAKEEQKVSVEEYAPPAAVTIN